MARHPAILAWLEIASSAAASHTCALAASCCAEGMAGRDKTSNGSCPQGAYCFEELTHGLALNHGLNIPRKWPGGGAFGLRGKVLGI